MHKKLFPDKSPYAYQCLMDRNRAQDERRARAERNNELRGLWDEDDTRRLAFNKSPPTPPRASPSHSPCTVLYLFRCFRLAVQVFRILCKKFWHVTPFRLSQARRKDCRCTQGWQCLNSTTSKVEICTRNSRGCKQFCLGPFGLIERSSFIMWCFFWFMMMIFSMSTWI